MNSTAATVSARGAGRWVSGHPWIYRSDVTARPSVDAGAVLVRDPRGRPLGWALWSPRSEISLRLLDRDPDARIDADWWSARLAESIGRRAALAVETNAYRLVHGDADRCPSLVCDRYDRWLVVQLASAGLEAFRAPIVEALLALTRADGILARHDLSVRAREGLDDTVALLAGTVPTAIEVVEHGVRYLAAPWDGQKTGAFLDQRENRVAVGAVTRGAALDCFSYHGSFALHMARRATSVIALDSSAAALERVAANAERNGATNVRSVEADAFTWLKAAERARTRFDTIVLDPPAFAKSRAAVPAALRGYKEINLRGMRLLAPGGLLYTASCSHHVGLGLFLEMLQSAAEDSGRRLTVRRMLGQPTDHPAILTIPETGYIKGALVEALD
jgi:23S rRNA (cytosine1962-C5)-methyltransferase